MNTVPAITPIDLQQQLDAFPRPILVDVRRRAAFDADPFVLACANGTLDLRTGALRPHDPNDLLSLGTDSAETRGLPVTSAQRRAFFSASLATGAAVSIGGPVGFIGIIVPHLVRLIVGSDHRVVLPASALFGAAFLVGCDVLARTLMAPVEIPVGVITALIGGPFFLWLLVRKT